MNIIERSATRFAIQNADGQELGYLDFHVDDVYYYLDYVYVNPAFRGQSVGQDIVKAAIAAAEQRNLKPMPICGYAKVVMKRIGDKL